MTPDYQSITKVAVASSRLLAVCPGKMIVKFRGWPRDMDMCEDVSVTEPPIKKRLAEFQQVLNSYWVRESNPYCKIENLEY